MHEYSSPPRNDDGARPAAMRLAQTGLLIGLTAAVVALSVNVWLAARLIEQQQRGSRERAF